MERLVMHVDMDAFFASIEQRDHEEYRGKPLIVGGLSGRGVVSTCSYEARRFGVHSAMPIVRARRLCPQGIFVEGDYAHYKAVSQEIFAIFARYAPVVEPLSIDEAFLDLTGMELLMESPRAYAEKLKAEIREKTGLIASVGIAPNKFLAKLASDLEKPDGLVIITEQTKQAVLDPLPVSRIWGVGKKTAARLEDLRIRTIGQLRRTPRERLARDLGAHMADHLLALASGIDTRPVGRANRRSPSARRSRSPQTSSRPRRWSASCSLFPRRSVIACAAMAARGARSSLNCASAISALTRGAAHWRRRRVTTRRSMRRHSHSTGRSA